MVVRCYFDGMRGTLMCLVSVNVNVKSTWPPLPVPASESFQGLGFCWDILQG